MVSQRREQLLLVLALVVALVVIGWTSRQPVVVEALDARTLLRTALAQYDAIPPFVVNDQGLVHRRWEINSERPLLQLVADEWADPRDPARHRMQLTVEGVPMEWQGGDGVARLHYYGMLARSLCGATLPSIQLSGNRINVWPSPAEEQRRLRTARWQSGFWAVGQRYLSAALRTPALHVITASGPDAPVTVAAQTMSQTVLIRLDPRRYTLREVTVLTRHGTTTRTTTPWRRVLTETMLPDDRFEPFVVSFPLPTRPQVLGRQPGIVDPMCPLTDRDHAIAVNTFAARFPLIGLPAPPAALHRAILIAEAASSRDSQGQWSPERGAVQLIYHGPGKRLVVVWRANAPADADIPTSSGPWLVHLDPQALGIWAGQLLPNGGATAQRLLPGFTGSLRVWAEGWDEAELVAVLGQLQPLQPPDWAAQPQVYYDPAVNGDNWR